MYFMMAGSSILHFAINCATNDSQRSIHQAGKNNINQNRDLATSQSVAIGENDDFVNVCWRREQ